MSAWVNIVTKFLFQSYKNFVTLEHNAASGETSTIKPNKKWTTFLVTISHVL